MPGRVARAVLIGCLLCMIAACATAQDEDGLESRILVLQDGLALQSQQLVRAQQVAMPGYRRRSRLQTPPGDIPAGTPLIGEYIVVYKAGVDVAAATADSQKRAASVVAAAAASGRISAASLATPPAVSLLTTPELLSRSSSTMLSRSRNMLGRGTSTTSSSSSSNRYTLLSTASSADRFASAASKDVADASSASATALADNWLAGSSANTDSTTDSSSISTDSGGPSPTGVGSTAVAAQVLVTVPEGTPAEEMQSALLASTHVHSVVQNRVVTLMPQVAAAPCAQPKAASGLTNPAWNSTRFAWKGCMSPATQLTFIGERCGNGLEKFKWTAIFTAKKGTTQLSNSSCVWLRSEVKNTTVMTDFFGDCGSAPTHFPELPSSVCMEATTSACINSANLSVTANLSKKACSFSPASRAGAAYQGAACGPNSAYIQWNRLSPTGCSAKDRTNTKNLLQQAVWLGQCGVPPFHSRTLPTRVCGSTTLSPSPSPVPDTQNAETSPAPTDSTESGYRSPATAQLFSGDTATWGMQRVGAYDSTARTVVDAAAAIDTTQMIVVTIDTGADVTHPDLAATLVDLVDVNSSANYNKDGNGHGTHVAGIVGAKNNGRGVTGVVPGMPVYAIKALGRDGSGMLSTVYAAFAHVLSLLQSGVKVVAVNMSLTMSDGVSAPDPSMVNVTCGYIKQIAAYGTAVVVAAGNEYAKSISNVLPALCPEAIAVTAFDSVDKPAAFSNIGPADGSSALLNKIIAAPGVSINSTYPVAKGSYYSQDGTSMASPFVTAGFAKCFLGGACKLSTSPDITPALRVNYPLVLAAARATACGASGRCAPYWETTNFYGYMLDVRRL